jgi:hypothetical protein
MIVTGTREAQRIVLGRPRLVTGWDLNGSDSLDAFKHPGDQRRRDAVIAIAAFLGDCDESRLNQFGEVLARGRTRNSREKCELAAGQGLPAHQSGQNSGARGIPDERRDLDHIRRGNHSQLYRSGGAVRKQPQFGTCRTNEKRSAAFLLR